MLFIFLYLGILQNQQENKEHKDPLKFLQNEQALKIWVGDSLFTLTEITS